jgi:hypothetical protein
MLFLKYISDLWVAAMSNIDASMEKTCCSLMPVATTSPGRNNIPRYVDTFKEEEIERLGGELAEVRARMNRHLKELCV